MGFCVVKRSTRLYKLNLPRRVAVTEFYFFIAGQVLDGKGIALGKRRCQARKFQFIPLGDEVVIRRVCKRKRKDAEVNEVILVYPREAFCDDRLYPEIHRAKGRMLAG